MVMLSCSCKKTEANRITIFIWVASQIKTLIFSVNAMLLYNTCHFEDPSYPLAILLRSQISTWAVRMSLRFHLSSCGHRESRTPSSSDLAALLLAPGEGSSGEDDGVFKCRGTVSGGGHRKQILLRLKNRQKHDIKAGKKNGSSSNYKTPQNPAPVLHPLLKRISWMFFNSKAILTLFFFFTSSFYISSVLPVHKREILSLHNRLAM